VSRQELAVLNFFAIVLHTLSGIAGVYLSREGNPAVSVVAPLFEFTSAADGAFFRPMPKNIFTVKILTPPVAVEFITAAFHVVYLLALVDTGGTVDAAIRFFFDTPSANPLRWFEYSVTATLMSVFGVISIGELDFNYFVRGIFAGISLQVCGYLLELLNSPDEAGGWLIAKPLRKRLNFIVFNALGMLINLPAVAMLLYQVFASKTHGAFWLFVQNTLPFAIWFNTFGVICQLTYNRYRQFADPYFSERWYILLSLSTKMAVFWLGFGTFKKITEDQGFSTRTGISWNAVRYSAMSIPAGILIVYAIYDARQWTRKAARLEGSVGEYRVYGPS
jgi:hypothetical protein